MTFFYKTDYNAIDLNLENYQTWTRQRISEDLRKNNFQAAFLKTQHAKMIGLFVGATW